MQCQGCRGRGVKVTLRHIGPGMVQQMQSVCHDCEGEGELIIENLGNCVSYILTTPPTNL